EERLDLAEDEVPARREDVMEPCEQPLLGVAVEVDEDVAAGDELIAAGCRGKVIQQVAAREANDPPHGGGDRIRRRCREVALAQLRGRLFESRLRKLAALRRGEAGSIDVGAENVEAVEMPQQAVQRRVTMEEYAEGVRLFTARAAGGPHLDRPLALPERRNDMLGDGLVHRPIAKQLRDVDGQSVEEAVIISRVA